jgi:hypothetical protein
VWQVVPEHKHLGGRESVTGSWVVISVCYWYLGGDISLLQVPGW